MGLVTVVVTVVGDVVVDLTVGLDVDTIGVVSCISGLASHVKVSSVIKERSSVNVSLF